MSEPWDVIVVGAGHNGLACAGYLAKAGQRVLVLETREVAGGGCATEQVTVPGFTHNLNSNFHGLIHWGPVYRELELERHGARYVWPENQFAHVFPDGRALDVARLMPRPKEGPGYAAAEKKRQETIRFYRYCLEATQS